MTFPCHLCAAAQPTYTALLAHARTHGDRVMQIRALYPAAEVPAAIVAEYGGYVRRGETSFAEARALRATLEAGVRALLERDAS